MAGLGHLVGVVPSLALSTAGAIVYLGAYLAGAVLAMTAFGWALGRLSRRGGAGRLRALLVLAGGAAVVVGIYWLSAAAWG
jgi:hypothetical protein